MTLRRYGFFFCFLLLSYATLGQGRYDPDRYLRNTQPLPKVMLVGVFHFEYQKGDQRAVEPKDQVDILSKKKQREVAEVVDYIARFKPTKIAIESGPNTGSLLKRYRDWRAGNYTLAKDEREQLGFRLLREMGLDTLYGVDDRPLVYDLEDGRDSSTIFAITDTIYKDWDFRSTDAASLRYQAYYKLRDSLEAQQRLLPVLKYMNADKVLNRGFGAYLTGDFKLGNTRGADALSMHWLNRNLRILRHIQQLNTTPQDRILVIYGSGHVEILKHLFECTPEFDLVKFGDLGKPLKRKK
jgi:Family of unknown function (DUF5694)